MIRRLLIARCFACLAGASLLAAACDKKPSPTTAGSTSVPAPSAAPTTSQSTEATSEFCASLAAKTAAFVSQCADSRDTSGFLQVIKSTTAHDADMCPKLSDVAIARDKVPACLDAMKTWSDASLVALQKKPACREAFTGKLEVGAKCSWDLQCPKGSFCVSQPSSDDALEMQCSPVVAHGTPCKMEVGPSCGSDFHCAAGKCVESGGPGSACREGAECAGNLVCLKATSNAKQGVCGPHRAAGQDCHGGAECAGVCVPTSKKSQDGKCTAFCGSE